jgi:hypothetical protein
MVSQSIIKERVIMRMSIIYTLMLLGIPSFGQEINYGTFCRANPVAEYSIKRIIVLKAAQTFDYEFIGHMIHVKASGNFTIDKNNIISFRYTVPGSNDNNDSANIDMAPKKMKYRDNRLYDVDKKGKVIKVSRLVSTHRRFYVFGDYSRRRLVFLKREDDVNSCN